MVRSDDETERGLLATEVCCVENPTISAQLQRSSPKSLVVKLATLASRSNNTAIPPPSTTSCDVRLRVYSEFARASSTDHHCSAAVDGGSKFRDVWRTRKLPNRRHQVTCVGPKPRTKKTITIVDGVRVVLAAE